MTEQQVPKLVASLVEHQSEFKLLTTGNAQWVIQNPKSAIALFVQAVENRQQEEQSKPEPQPFLTFTGTVKVQLMKKLVASEFFNENNSLVKISYVGDNFKTWFYGKVEVQPNADETEPGEGPYRTLGENGADKSVLCYYTLNRSSVDGPIIKELGGEDKVKTTLFHIAALMLKQPDGKQGALLTNGYANIFYVHDINGVLRAVRVRWYGRGWLVCACSVGFPDGWGAVCRVFSCDS